MGNQIFITNFCSIFRRRRHKFNNPEIIIKDLHESLTEHKKDYATTVKLLIELKREIFELKKTIGN